jgi:hypothetical protein
MTAGYKQNLIGFDSSGRILEQDIMDWLGYGGIQEDRPGEWYDYILGKPTRSINHFHNPLKSSEEWDEAGLDDKVLGISYTGQSQILWAQNPNQDVGGKWSWQDARENFYIALTGKDFNGKTVAILQKDREQYLAYTLRSIGQLMHLVQDASVPEHVRNDIHLLPAYEAKVEKIRTRKAKYDFLWDRLIADPIVFDKSILSISSTHPSAPSPISRIIDTDIYTGNNPDITKTQFNNLLPIPQNVGIAEYTNVNFLSKDTMFENDTLHNFPFPRTLDTTLWTDANKRTYIKKEGNGDTVEHLAVKSWLFDYRKKYFPHYNQKLPVSLDTECYKDYAQKLIPRAVGYSAGLLDYFFRGSIEITLPDSGVYGQADSPDTGFTEIKLLARNTSANDEQMTDGAIELVIGYRRAIDDPFINYPEDYAFRAEDEMTYLVVPEKNGIRSIPPEGPVELTFNLSENPIPVKAINVFLQLIYHGRLGYEEGAVVVGFKDISEPTPIDLFNDMNRICLNEIFYTAGSQDAVDLVDKGPGGNQNNIADEWDVYSHDMTDIYLKFSSPDHTGYASPADYDISIPFLYGGDFVRAAYILTDYNFLYNSTQSVDSVDPGDPWSHPLSTSNLYSGIAIKNQMEYEEDPAVCSPMSAPCHIWWYPTFLEYRGVNLWWGGGIMYINNAYPQGSECTCYQGILRNCITGVKTLKSFDYVGKSNVLKKHRGEYTTEENNLQMLPLVQKQRRMPLDE